MLVYRVFPHLPSAAPGQPGHPSYLHPGRGGGRLDNPASYSVWYLSYDPCGAIGEVFGNRQTWPDTMFTEKRLPGSRKALATLRLPDDLSILDLDDPQVLLDRGLRPSQVVARNRAVTQAWALRIFDERNDRRERLWYGVAWRSFQRPQWRLLGYWGSAEPVVVNVEPLHYQHYAVIDAAGTLFKRLSRK
ncbi:RES family NAD+ phosphorylase [Dactylosporangium sp. NPDC049140]|uniref:RES family NAD+ phosphorylase n=1 Tax=Dactylosporangium sp. NPDC049140 TaxID=3155647 RepID=UPI0033DC960E